MRQLSRRIAALEKVLTPQPQPIWTPWQSILTREEFSLCMSLAYPNLPPPWPENVRARCRDDAERAMLETILAKQPLQAGWQSLEDLFADLAL